MHARIALVAVASAAAVFAFGGVASVVAAPDVQTGKVAVRPFEYGDRVAFYGDSITRNGEAITRMAAYYRRAFPGRNVRFFNVGISGGTVSAAHIFFDKYLVPLRPTHVVLAFGVNDAGAVIADDAVARFESEYERLIERIQDIDAAVVLRTPTSFGVVSSNRSAAHGRIADSVRRIAEKRVLPLVDDHALFGERIAAGENLFIGDNVHPNERGQWCLSEDFIAAQGLDAGAFRPFVEVASESGLAAWHDAAVALTYIPATEWLVMHGEELSLDEKLAKARKWLDDNEGKDGVNPAILRFVREYLRIKPHEAEFRDKEENEFALVIGSAAGETRYLAANGDDARDGKTPETAWRTLSRLNDGLPSGGTALLRCGDVFFGQLAVSGGIDKDRRTVITSYGIGSKPVISGTKNLRDDPGIWHVHFTPDHNRWSMDLTDPANYTGLDSDNANPGFLLVDGEVKPWKRYSRYDVNEQWDFAGEDGRLYLHSTNNPALLSHDIRVAVEVRCVQLRSHTVVSNIAVRATGGHGMLAGWSETLTTDIRIVDCEFENIGGSELVGFEKTHDDLRVRYGNGVEFGSNCSDAIVERCEFSGIYDVAFTMQGFPTTTSWSDIHMRNCIVRDSSQAFEVWCNGAAPGIGFVRCSFTDNRTVNVGGGWGALVRPNRHTATPLLVYAMETDTVDIDVSGNTFENAPRGIVHKRGGIDKMPSGYRIHDNAVLDLSTTNPKEQK